ncbi:hypothetical protein C0993_002139 [Termitomyces sp. T159_Od127]|nr:hypothetical protein C0993_002139 [Termitomyces sp. T159_Od127]
MSRAPPFPTSRRSPSVNGSNISAPLSFSPSTRPLQISQRSTAPGNGPHPPPSPRLAPSNPPSNTPARPHRSELRSRASDNLELYNDTLGSARSDASLVSRPRPGATSPSIVAKAKPRPQPLQSPIDNEGDLSTPTSLVSALSAFKSAGSRRRDMMNESDDVEYQAERQNALEAEKARQQRIRDKVPGRRTNGKARAGDIDAVLDQIKDGWEFIIDPDFNNVDLALQLLEDSSHGKDMDSFRRTKEMLGQALKGSVDKHYQAFAASLPHQATLLSHLDETQAQIHSSRTSLLEAKEALGNKRADLVQLWARGQTLDEMLRLLDQIEHLKAVPDLLETLMSEKRLLQAAVLLVKSLKTINKSDMLEIGAVADLRSYLINQETALRDVLVDELQNHLYLKSFWCDTRWAAYTPNQQTFPKIEFEVEEEGSFKPSNAKESTPTSPLFRPSRQARFLSALALKPNEPPIDLSDLSPGNSQSLTPNLSSAYTATANNPEADSFSYMETLIESLAVLGKLGSAMDTISQKLPGEIFSLVENTLDEVEERAEYGRRAPLLGLNETMGRTKGAYIFASEGPAIGSTVPAKDTFLRASCLRLAALESSSKRVEHEILKDLFWTLYSKLDAVAQGLRVVYEVTNRIGSRRDFRDSSGAKPGSLFPLAEVWTAVQAEVRTLIYDYLTDEEQGSVSGRHPISSINEILRDGKLTRDRAKAVFRFADTNTRITAKALKPHEDELTRVLNDTMPGLVAGSGDTVQTTLTSVGTDDRMLGADQHHRLIIRPDVFHVSVLFQPTLAFLTRLSTVLPFGAESERASSAVLDEFVLKVYLPQLEEKVSELFHQAVTGTSFSSRLRAFLFSSTKVQMHSNLTPRRASTELMALINSLCYMLATSPFHRENYSRLILGVIIQFYQRCSDRFQDLVTFKDVPEPKLEPKLALAAQWAQQLEEEDGVKVIEICRRESNLEIQLLGQKAMKQTDLIPSVRNLALLAALYRSVSWFTSALNALKARSDDPLSLTSPQNPDSSSGTTPFIPIIPIQEHLQLPLSKEMSLEATEPDPYIADLNAELVKCDDLVSTCLPVRERQ